VGVSLGPEPVLTGQLQLERSDLVRGWAPDGFAGGAGERRTFSRY
jgi:hypothetical protein